MKARKIIYFFALTLLFCITGLVYHFIPSEAQPIQSTPPITVETSRIQQVSVAEQAETIGNLNSLNQINISSELAGQIKAIHFKPGKFVKKGTLLIELDDSILRSELAAAEASLVLSKSNYTRTAELARRRIASAQAMDEALADYEDKQNQVAIKKAQLQKMKLKAPFSGTVGARHISVGQYVNVGESLVKLVDNRNLRVEYRLGERYLAELSAGQKVSILSDAYPGQVFNATVNFIDPSVDENTRSIAIEALVDNKEKKLSPGLFVRINHQFSRETQRLLVPEESLIPSISGQKIFIYKNGKAITVNVETGAHHADKTEILKGLDPSDIIITRGQHKLKDGTSVIDVHRG